MRGGCCPQGVATQAERQAWTQITAALLVENLGDIRNTGFFVCLFFKRHRFDPWVGKIPWRRKWQPTLVFLPEESHGQKSLAGYSPWGHKEWGTTKRLTTHL